MRDSDRGKLIVERSAAENEYLHRDFHGVMCFIIKHLDETGGTEATREFLRGVGTTVFAPLIEDLKGRGLDALEVHWRNVFGAEGGTWALTKEGNTLVLRVDECPAVAHLKKRDQLLTDRFCEATKIVNQVVCEAAGYEASCEYVAGAGSCVQRFWLKGECP
jgi:hypothetical protein